MVGRKQRWFYCMTDSQGRTRRKYWLSISKNHQFDTNLHKFARKIVDERFFSRRKRIVAREKNGGSLFLRETMKKGDYFKSLIKKVASFKAKFQKRARAARKKAHFKGKRFENFFRGLSDFKSEEKNIFNIEFRGKHSILLGIEWDRVGFDWCTWKKSIFWFCVIFFGILQNFYFKKPYLLNLTAFISKFFKHNLHIFWKKPDKRKSQKNQKFWFFSMSQKSQNNYNIL